MDTDNDDLVATPVADLTAEDRRAAMLAFRTWSTTDQAAARILAAGGHWLGDDALFAAAAEVWTAPPLPVSISWYWASVATYAQTVDAPQGLRDLLVLAASIGLDRRHLRWSDDHEDQDDLAAVQIDPGLALARIGATAGAAAAAEVLAALATLVADDPAADLSTPGGRAAAIGHLEADIHAADTAHAQMTVMIEAGLPDVDAFIRLADTAEAGTNAAAYRMFNFQWEQQLDCADQFTGPSAADEAKRLRDLVRKLHGCRGSSSGLRGRVQEVIDLHTGGETADARFDEARTHLAE